MVVFWDVIDEKWQTLHISSIGDIERMTGYGVKHESDSVAPEKFIALFESDWLNSASETGLLCCDGV